MRFFAENGYPILDDLGLGDFDAFADRLIAEIAPLHEGGKFNRLMDAWTASDAVRELATNPTVIRCLEPCTGAGRSRSRP